jgi:hypothetical protein
MQERRFVSCKVKKMYDFLLISQIVCRLHKSDRSTQKTDSRKKVAHASDEQEVSTVKVTFHAWHADTCEKKGATDGVSSLYCFSVHICNAVFWKISDITVFVMFSANIIISMIVSPVGSLFIFPPSFFISRVEWVLLQGLDISYTKSCFIHFILACACSQ